MASFQSSICHGHTVQLSAMYRRRIPWWYSIERLKLWRIATAGFIHSSQHHNWTCHTMRWINTFPTLHVFLGGFRCWCLVRKRLLRNHQIGAVQQSAKRESPVKATNDSGSPDCKAYRSVSSKSRLITGGQYVLLPLKSIFCSAVPTLYMNCHSFNHTLNAQKSLS